MVACQSMDPHPHPHPKNPLKGEPVTSLWWQEPVYSKTKPKVVQSHWADPWSDFAVVHSGVIAPVVSRSPKTVQSFRQKLEELLQKMKRAQESPFDDTL